MCSHRFGSLGITKCPAGGHFIIPGGDEGIISLRCITWQNLRRRANRRTPVRLFAAVRTLAPGFESTLSNTIKNTPAGRDFLLWRRRRDSLARHIRVGCGATVTICPRCTGQIYLLSNRQSAIAMCSHRFVSLGITKCPAGGILLFLAAQGIFYLWLMKDLRPTHEWKG